MVTRLTSTVLRLQLPALPAYAIVQPETIGLRVPAEVVVSRAVLDAVNALEVVQSLASRIALLTGPLRSALVTK